MKATTPAGFDSSRKGDPSDMSNPIKQKTTKEGGEANGGKENPFTRRSGLERSPQRSPGEGDGEARGGSEEVPVEVKMDGPTLTRVIKSVMANHEERGGHTMEVVTEVSDVIMSFLDNRVNYSKDLKLAVQALCALVVEAKTEWRSLLEASKSAEKELRKLVKERKQADKDKEEAELKIRLLSEGKRLAESQVEELRKRMAVTGATPKLSKVTQEANLKTAVENSAAPKSAKRKKVEQNDGHPKPLNPVPPPVRTTEARREEDLPWREVVNPKKARRQRQQTAEKAAGGAIRATVKKGRAQKTTGEPSNVSGKRKDKGEAIIVSTDDKSYAEVLKAMRVNDKLAGLGEDVNCIRRTRRGEMILVLKRDAAQKSSEYKKLTEEVLGDGVQVRALCPVSNIQCKGLDEVTEARDLVDALRDQCNVEIQESTVRLRKSFAGMQVASFQVPQAEAKKVMDKAKLKVGWSVCPLSISQPLQTCFRCLGNGHKSYDCKGPDRSKLCRRCGAEGHQARTCQAAPRCLICPPGTDNRHLTGVQACPASRRTQTRR